MVDRQPNACGSSIFAANLNAAPIRPGPAPTTCRPWPAVGDDNGLTWSEPIDLTKVARDYDDPAWQASVVGPGGAIQTRSGRLVAPVWKVKPYGVLAIFSDDHGQTWQRGSLMPGDHGGDEDQIVELVDGRLLLDIRQETGPNRFLATSSDAGQTWSDPRPGVCRIAGGLRHRAAHASIGRRRSQPDRLDRPERPGA